MIKFINPKQANFFMPRVAFDIVQFKGLELLNDEERAFLDKIVPEYYEKIKRSLKNLVTLQIHFKAYETTGAGKEEKGKRRKFDIHIRAISPTKNIFVSTKPPRHFKSRDWNFSKSLHEAFKNLENQIKKKLHTDKSHPRPRD